MGTSVKPDRRETREPRPQTPEDPEVDRASLRTGLAGALAARREASSGEARRRRARRAWAVGAAVAVTVIAVLAAAYYDFGGRPRADSSATGPAPTSYYGTLGTALATARSSFWSWPPGGPSLVFAEGLASPAVLPPAVNATHLGAVACAPTQISTPIGSLPAFGGALSSGLAPEWLYAFLATGNTLVVVAVANGTSAVVATTPTNGACYNGPGAFTTVPVDSSVAAAAAAATAKSSKFFTTESANSTPVGAEFFLAPPGYVGGAPPGVPIWVVTDTTCDLYGSTATHGSTFASVVNAATGALVSQKTSSVTC